MLQCFRKQLLLFTLALLFTFSYGQKYARIEKDVSNFNYQAALEKLQQKSYRNKAKAIYLKALIYSRPDCLCYNPDSTYLLCLQVLSGNTKKADSTILSKVKYLKNVTELNTFSKAKEANTLEAFQCYVTNFSKSGLKDSAVFYRDEIAFKMVERSHNWRDYKRYLTTFPSSHLSAKATERYNSLLYFDLTDENVIESYEQFLKKYPDSPYRMDAESWIYKLATIEGNIGDYELFIKKYPENHHVNEAWNAIYNLYTVDGNAMAIEAFQLKYPQYPHLSRLIKDLENSRKFFFPVKKNGLWGYADSSANLVIEPKYTAAEYFINNYAIVESNGKFGIITKSSQLIVDTVYDEVDYFEGGISIVKRGEKFGAVNTLGNLVLSPVYEDLINGKGNSVIYKEKELYGIYDKNGKRVVEPTYESLSSSNNGLLIAIDDGKSGAINENGAILIPFEYDWIEPFYRTITRAKKDGLFGIIDKNGAVVLPFNYTSIKQLADSSYLLVKENKCGFADSNGQLVISEIYDYSNSYKADEGFVNECIKVEKDRQRGLINKTGKVVVPFKFDDVGNISEEKIALNKRGKWGYANLQLKMIIKPQFESASDFKNGFAIVKKNGKYAVIDADGIVLTGFDFTGLKFLMNDLFLAENDLGKFIIDSKGINILNATFEEAEVVNEHYIRFTRMKSVDYYDLKGKRFVWIEDGF